MVITSWCIRGGSSTQQLVVNCKRDANCCKKPQVIPVSNLWLSEHLQGINTKMVLSHTIWLNASYFSRWYCTEIKLIPDRLLLPKAQKRHPGTDRNIGEKINLYIYTYCLQQPQLTINDPMLPMLHRFMNFVAITPIFHWQNTQNNHV